MLVNEKMFNSYGLTAIIMLLFIESLIKLDLKKTLKEIEPQITFLVIFSFHNLNISIHREFYRISL